MQCADCKAYYPLPSLCNTKTVDYLCECDIANPELKTTVRCLIQVTCTFHKVLSLFCAHNSRQMRSSRCCKPAQCYWATLIRRSPCKPPISCFDGITPFVLYFLTTGTRSSRLTPAASWPKRSYSLTLYPPLAHYPRTRSCRHDRNSQGCN